MHAWPRRAVPASQYVPQALARGYLGAHHGCLRRVKFTAGARRSHRRA